MLPSWRAEEAVEEALEPNQRTRSQGALHSVHPTSPRGEGEGAVEAQPPDAIHTMQARTILLPAAPLGTVLLANGRHLHARSEAKANPRPPNNVMQGIEPHAQREAEGTKTAIDRSCATSLPCVPAKDETTTSLWERRTPVPAQIGPAPHLPHPRARTRQHWHRVAVASGVAGTP